VIGSKVNGAHTRRVENVVEATTRNNARGIVVIGEGIAVVVTPRVSMSIHNRIRTEGTLWGTGSRRWSERGGW